MPIYEYHCDACNRDFEEWHKHADDIQHLPCPECKAEAHRVISNTSFVLKGGGWYVTEYGNRKTDGASSSAAPATPEAKSDAAPASGGSTESPKAETPKSTTPPPAAAKTESTATTVS